MSQRTGDLIFNIVLLLFFITLLTMAVPYGPEAKAVPMVVLMLGLVLVCYRIIANIRERFHEKGTAGKEAVPVAGDFSGSKKFISMAGWVLALVVSIWILGFNFGAPLFVFLFLVGHREKWPFSLCMAGATWAVLYGIFGTAMKLPFYQGEFFLFLMKQGIYLPF